jgi:DNA-directed RNA polymerase specialized sigma24 family protein
MSKSELTKETLDKLLSWLDPDREQSGKKYETIRSGLVRIFTYWGCVEADELADETINRVAGKIETIGKMYVGSPSHYFYGVARKVHLEHRRRKTKIVPLPPDLSLMVATPETLKEVTYECLEHCLQQLTPDRREMIWHYFQEGSSAKQREELARHLGIKISTLRVKIFRSISTLEPCVKKCVEKADA